MDSKQDMPISSHHIQQSIVLLMVKIIALVFAVETVYALLLAFFLFSGAGAEFHDAVFSFLWFIQTAKFLLLVYLILATIIPTVTTNYYVSEHHLIKYEGLLRNDETIYELNKLRSVKLHEDWLGRLLNYGDLLIVVSSSGYHEEVKLTSINNPKKYERVLREFLSEPGAVK